MDVSNQILSTMAQLTLRIPNKKAIHCYYNLYSFFSLFFPFLIFPSQISFIHDQYQTPLSNAIFYRPQFETSLSYPIQLPLIGLDD